MHTLPQVDACSNNSNVASASTRHKFHSVRVQIYLSARVSAVAVPGRALSTTLTARRPSPLVSRRRLLFVAYRTCLRRSPFDAIPNPLLQLVPRLRKFNSDLKILNTVLTDLIARAKSSEDKADLEDLQARNYEKVRRSSRMMML